MPRVALRDARVERQRSSSAACDTTGARRHRSRDLEVRFHIRAVPAERHEAVTAAIGVNAIGIRGEVRIAEPARGHDQRCGAAGCRNGNELRGGRAAESADRVLEFARGGAHRDQTVTGRRPRDLRVEPGRLRELRDRRGGLPGRPRGAHDLSAVAIVPCDVRERF